jgi:site-specific DNA recombinase
LGPSGPADRAVPRHWRKARSPRPAGVGPGSLDATLNQLADQAAAGTDDTSARTEAAQARIADLDKKIAQYRASLDAGGDPTVIGPWWIAETQVQKLAARAEIRSATGQRRMTKDEIAAIVAALGDLVQVIRDADPADKADLYAQLGLTLTYRPQKRLVEASVTPSLHMCKGFVSEGDSVAARGAAPPIR